ncbi:MAG: isoaspartyl peptidase/L-asparaginase [Sandarakinorhabdus sp.]|nr:isoaspartyl peptidase/L-asparaginase [Sandarakinorhabdus sp.]
MHIGWRAVLTGLILGAAVQAAAAPAEGWTEGWAIALHGGAGVIERGSLTPETEASVRQALDAALKAGEDVLAAGGTAVVAVEAVVRVLEDSPHFNAGHGAVFTSAGTIELDAAIMDGRTLASGAVTGVTTTRNPVSLARALMLNGPHVFLSGAAADGFAKASGLEQVPNSFFMTERRRKQLEDLKMRNLEGPGQGAGFDAEVRFGTVGAVARDKAGNLAAATSTGGLTGKAPGRVGDTPVIGAGTIADNRSCAVSGTGTGEIFIRTRAAGQICDRVRFGGQELQAAADAAVAEIGALGGSGGVIVLGTKGDGLFAMNSSGMYRASASAGGRRSIAIYADEQ